MRISDWSSDVCSSDLSLARIAREHVDHARRAVAAVERALRPLQHLHALHIEKGKREEEIGRLVDVVDMQRRRRSEEHTSELQSLMRISYAVFCLKKKKKIRRCKYIKLKA